MDERIVDSIFTPRITDFYSKNVSRHTVNFCLGTRCNSRPMSA